MCFSCNLDRRMAEVSAAHHPTNSEWIWVELAILHEKWNVLEHPFYLRWSAGELTRRELQAYAAEYDHLVVALAVASRNAACKASDLLAEALAGHAEEEEAHIALWRAFARGTGLPSGLPGVDTVEPAAETVECARVWAGDASRSLALDLVTLHAIEAPQPDIAQTKLDGLLGSYGFEDGPATEYFRLHAELDKHHAALAQSALEGLLPAEDPFGLLAQAEAVHRGYWTMLDGLERGTTAWRS